MMPGIVVIHHGGNYEPDKEGVDWGCTPNIFLTDPESPVTAPLVSNLVQVERFDGSAKSVLQNRFLSRFGPVSLYVFPLPCKEGDQIE